MPHPLNYIVIPGFENYPHVTYTWVLMAGLLIISFLITRSLQLIPYGGQNLLEGVADMLLGFMDNVMGEEGRPYFFLIATLGLFILLSNLMGIIPGFVSPTANINTNGACALTVFIMTHVVGLKTHGMKYVKHFTGPIPWLAPLMVPIEVIAHLARPLSLTIRLFGNIRGEDLVIIILFFLVPVVVPSFMMLFAIFTSFVQAFIFVVLSMIYITGSLEHAH